jgi:hypothetical protein
MALRVRDAVSLVLVSFLVLFYELAFIRFLPSVVLSLAYFSNIVLLSCFLGFGLGCLLGRRRDGFPRFPLILLVVVATLFLFHRIEVVVPAGSGEWVWSQYARNVVSRPWLTLGILPTLIAVFLLNAAAFLPLGQQTGRLMERFRPLHAYGLNILGGLLGIIGFSALSFVGGWANTPVVWFAVGGCLMAWFAAGSRRGLLLLAASTVGLCLIVGRASHRQLWSPYYSVQLKARSGGAFDVYVNRFFHQAAVNFDQHAAMLEKYSLPYRLRAPRKLLILGGGAGNDAAVALRHGVPEIHVVEIDPLIAELGRRLHPDRPYERPEVRVIVDDARAWLRRTTERYDMIVFGTLDSHALLAGASTVRLDNFVYTLESLRDAKRLLTDDGLLVLLFSVPTEWLKRKMLDLVLRVLGEPPPAAYEGDEELFNLLVLAGPGLPRALQDHPEAAAEFTRLTGPPSASEVPTDDWPYLYLPRRAIPAQYLQAIAFLTAVSAAAILWAAPGGLGARELPFLALGCAFMLLETKSVTTLSLLFGSTWLVNAFVFGAILLMSLLSALLVSRIRIARIGVVYGLLGLALLLDYMLPVGAFLAHGFWIRSLLSALLVALPVFFSGLVFAHQFQSARRVSAAFGANLIGAVLGGFLEYASMLTGLNQLYLLAGLCYVLAFLGARRAAPT